MADTQTPRVAALVVAAGRGQRLGGDLPKQYRSLGGKPLLRHTLERLAGHPAVDLVQAVIHPADRELYDQAAADLALPEPAPGGAERQDSVRAGLEALSGAAPRIVLIHDAARPFPAAAMVDRVLQAVAPGQGAVPSLPVSDSLKRGEDGYAVAGVSRDGLWRVQTPQGFHFEDILAAHRAAAGQSLTDDAAVAESAGMKIKLVEGSLDNEKMTTAEDFARAEAIHAARREIRSGQGFDVHRFTAGDGMMLCGVRLEHERTLVGHSDADVGLHAVTDALLGALASGDIGSHFPPGDPQWKNSDSRIFLEEAARQVAARDGRILNVDVTLICEAPKIGPHRQAMREAIAGILQLSPRRVSVKATTTEGLGFAGRREGIAAQAVVTLELPSDA